MHWWTWLNVIQKITILLTSFLWGDVPKCDVLLFFLKIFIENTGQTLGKRFMYIILRFIYETKYLLEYTINIYFYDKCSLAQTLKTINVLDGHK